MLFIYLFIYTRWSILVFFAYFSFYLVFWILTLVFTSLVIDLYYQIIRRGSLELIALVQNSLHHMLMSVSRHGKTSINIVPTSSRPQLVIWITHEGLLGDVSLFVCLLEVLLITIHLGLCFYYLFLHQDGPFFLYCHCTNRGSVQHGPNLVYIILEKDIFVMFVRQFVCMFEASPMAALFFIFSFISSSFRLRLLSCIFCNFFSKFKC